MDDYEILECIGEGSFGRALLCRHVTLDHKFVIKQVDMSSQPVEIQEASLRESELLSELNHPNIVKFYDSFFEGDVLCTVMEYASGGDLSAKIKGALGQHFSEFCICDWFTQICLAVQYIHSKHILHRDIKSQNIFIDEDGIVKLGDFGTAKCLEETGEFAETVVGSPFYLSPEICSGVPYNSKTDIWSLGCVLYEMCTLEPAFGGECIGGIVMKILRSEQPPIPGEYSEDLQNLVDWMLQKSPGRRPTISQILGLSFLKPLIPSTGVSTVTIKRMSEAEIREKRPMSILAQKEKKIKKPVSKKVQDVGLCLMVKPLQKQSGDLPQRPVSQARKSGVPYHPKRYEPKKAKKVDLGNCLQVNKLSSKSNESFDCPVIQERTKEASMEEIEKMRVNIERILGTEKMILAYNAIKDGENGGKIMKIVGHENKKAVVLLQRLIICEESV